MKLDAFTNKAIVIISLVVGAVYLTSCTDDWDRRSKRYEKDPLDWNANLSRSEINEALRPQRPELHRDKDCDNKHGGENAASIPPLSPVIIAPDSPEVKSSKRVSLTITENINLREVFLELARLAELELALDPNIKGGIILSVNNRPIKDVIEMICDAANLRYTVENGVLKVEMDAPYLVNYNVDFLNLVRSSKGQVTSTVAGGNSSSGSSSGSSGSSGGSGGSSSSGGTANVNSGSSNEVTMEVDGKFWESLNENLTAILGTRLATLKAGGITEEEIKGATPTTTTTTKVTKPGEVTEEEVVVKPKDLETKVKPIDQASKAAAPNSYYTINKQAGVISVLANKRKQKSVGEYIDRLRESMSMQVLIEAKVIEVTLNEEFNGGIDWAGLGGKDVSLQAKFAPAIADVLKEGRVFSAPSKLASSFTVANTTPNAILQMIEGFGVSRTLSNPRITVTNNQQAVLTFTTNLNYYTVTGTPSATTTNTTTTSTLSTIQIPTITSTLHTIPIGVILTLQPSIDMATKEVTMHIRPTLTDTAGDGPNDPAIDILRTSVLVNIPAGSLSPDTLTTVNGILGALKSTVPNVRVREVDTVLKAKSGEVMVIGGLIQHIDKSAENGFPFLDEVPFFGRLAKVTEHQSSVVETVILIQPTIVQGHYYHNHDKKLYETFAQDPRPLLFD